MQVSAVLKLSILFVLSSACLFQTGFAQTEQLPGTRKLVARVTPVYPPLARNMNLTGAVKLEALVLANGTVKKVQTKGGNPVFAQAAESAVRAWKWEKSDRDTLERIEIIFTP